MKVKKILNYAGLVYIILMLFLVTSNKAFAKESEKYEDVLTYDTFYEDITDKYTEQEIKDHINTGIKEYYIDLDKECNVTLKMQSTGKEGNVDVNVKLIDGDLDLGSYKNLLIGNQEITIKLATGKYKIQIQALKDQEISYLCDINYGEVTEDTDKGNENATIKFLKDEYSLDLEGMEKYNEGSFEFFEELVITDYENCTAKDISWSVDKTSIATIDKEGNIIPKKPGKVKLTAKLLNGSIATCSIEIPKPEYVIKKTKCTLYKGESSKIKVTAMPAQNDIKITWNSSNKKIARVSKNGKITAIKAGKCTITAKIDGKTLNCKVTVKNPKYTINKESEVLEKGEEMTLYVESSPSYENLDVKWSSSNEKIAIVNKYGEVKTREIGNCTISGKIDGKTLKCYIGVYKNPNEEVNVAKYLNDAKLLGLYKNSSFSFKSKNNKVTYIKIKGGNATFKGVGKYDLLKSEKGKLKGFYETGKKKKFLNVITSYRNTNTNAKISVTTVFGVISKIEYWR